MKYISAQPETLYYKWQVDTMINSFLQNGVDQSDIIILTNKKQKDQFDMLREKYPYVSFHRYATTDNNYGPEIKPALMLEYFTEHTEDEQYFYSDCDVVLTKPLPEFEQGKVYMSNTVSYIGYNYIISKGKEVLDIMCSKTGMDEETLFKNNDNSGGCQFVFNTLPADVWKKAYIDSIKLFDALTRYNRTIEVKNGYPIQAWTAEMWATLWSMWYYGYFGTVDKRLDFAWSTDPIDRIEKKAILHNAGVTNQKDLFKKHSYINRLPVCNLTIDETKCSSYYYKKVKEVLCT